MQKWNILLQLVAALAVTVCAFRESDHVKSIRPGKEYTFEYQTQVLTGISVDNKQYAGLKLKANVTLQTKDGITITCQIQPSCRILKVNDVVRDYRPSEIIPDSQMEMLQGAEKQQIVHQLIKPFKFKMEPGRFVDLQCEPSEPYFSVNIKRGLLSLMQLDLARANEIREESDEERIMSRLNIVSPHRHPKRSYRTMEEDVTGVCESVYTVLPSDRMYSQQDQLYDSFSDEPRDPWSDSVRNSGPRDAQSLRVTKVKNYDNCRVRPVVHTGLLESIYGQLPEWYEKKLTSFQSESDYKIRSNVTNYLPQWAKLVSKQHFSNAKAEKGTILTTTVQQMRLIDIRDTRSSIRTARDLQKKSLIMELPKPQGPARNQEERRESKAQVHAKCGVVEELLNELVAKTSPYIKADAAVSTAKLTLMMSELPTSEIQAFVDKYCTPDSVRSSDPAVITKSQVLLDILPTLGRPEVVPTIRKLVKDQVISQERASYMIAKMSLASNPHSDLVKDLLSLAKAESLPSASPLLKRTCLLTAGSVMYKLMNRQRQPAGRVAWMDSELDKLSQEVTNMLHSGRQVDEKVDVIRCMGNAGLPQFLPVLKQVIENRENHLSIRTKAMFALRRIAPVMKSKVLDICMSEHLDITKPQKLRIAAFIICMNTQPSFGVMKMITQNIKKEPSLQVGSFVYSYLKSLSKSSVPFNRNLTIEAKKALKYAKPIHPGFMYSKVRSTDLFDEDRKFGVALALETLATRRSAVPETVVLNSLLDFFGSPISNQIGVETEGMQTLFKNIVGPQSMLKELLDGRLSFSDVLRPMQKSSPAVYGRIRDMMQKIQTIERKLSNFAASSYIKFFNQELMAINFDSTYMESLFQYVFEKAPEFMSELSRGKNFKYLHTLSLVDGSVSVPTPCGMPVSLNLTTVTMFGAQGSVRLTNAPSFRDILNLAGYNRDRYSSSRNNRRSQYEQDEVESRDEHSRYLNDQRRNWRQEPTTDSSRQTTIFLDIKPSLVSETCVCSGVTLGPLKTSAALKTKIHFRLPSTSETKIDLFSGKLKTKFDLKNNEQELVRMQIEPVTLFTKTPAHPTTTPYICEQKIVEFPQVFKNSRAAYSLPCESLGLNFNVAIDENVKKVPTPLSSAFFAKKYAVLTSTPQRDAPKEIEVQLLYLSPSSNSPRSLINSVLGDEDNEPNQEERQRYQYQSEDERDQYQDQYQPQSESEEEEQDSGWNSWGWIQNPFRSDSEQHVRRIAPGSREAHGLNEVRPDSDIPSAFKHQIIASIRTKGDKCQRKLKAQFTHIHSEDFSKYQDDLQVVQKSCSKDPAEEYKYNLKSKVHGDILNKWLGQGPQPQTTNTRDCLSKVEAYSGPVGQLSKAAECKIKIGREAPEDHQSRPIPSPITVRAEIDYSPSHPSCFSRSLYFLRNQLAKLPQWAGKHCSMQSKPQENPENRLEIVANFISKEGQMQLALKDPRQTTIVKGLPLMFHTRLDASYSLAEIKYHRHQQQQQEQQQQVPILRGRSPAKNWMHYVSGGRYQGKCELRDDQCETFDKKRLNLPQTDCEVILAKDCSSQSEPAFLVVMEKQSKSEPKKDIKIYLPNRRIKIKAQSGSNDAEAEVAESHGQYSRVDLSNDRQKTSIKDPQSSKKIADIWKEGNKVAVHCHESGLSVKSDGNKVEIHMDPSYHGQVCGVCSNYNSEPHDDLEGPRKEKHSNAASFMLSYTINKPSCNYEELRQQAQSRN